ncbi:tRNA (adenine(58)-N(1))-methyltransferase catalytic subunit TRM61 [Vanrija pseudolonga]|uniref:tRNA (adenine(58)-N(1))-methyltransferase catalytic subunit TRM61 n=1 Tax=Vanrija pseudolonga TaxID=143232 RepID=A0AAF0Y706_9TREE|nr:tRNA (adenine(58)-N(1))-methyltransferase catalytic subunit TRM61 [Vanrija pseudolonga]
MPSMFHSRVTIEAGDLVIIFMSRDNMTAITVTPGEFFHNKFGRYSHDEMIGVKFGSKLHSPPPQSGYIHLLRPTPELWTLSLPHRTQILYMPDIAYIIQRLCVRVGGKVIEAGTGSGSMTHSLSRAVGKRGLVNSFEYHKTRFEKAGEEFTEHGLTNVHLQHRNVCKDGFNEVKDVEAIFLDLPAPWEAIPHAVDALNPNLVTRICCFSPCIEQVTKTASALRDYGFSDVATQEVLIRTYDLVPPPPQNSHHLEDVSQITQRLRDHEKRKEERRVTQMRNAREKARILKEQQAKEEAEARGETEGESKEVDMAEDGTASRDKRKPSDEPSDEKESSKKPRTEGPEATTSEDLVADTEDPTEPTPTTIYDEPSVAWNSMVLIKPSPEMRGHTSYLTFATLYPAAIRAQLAAQDEATLRVPASTTRVGRVGELAAKADVSAADPEPTEVSEYGAPSFDAALGEVPEEELLPSTGP